MKFIITAAACASILKHAHAAEQAAATLALTEPERTHAIDIVVTVDNLPYDDYWANTVAAIFAFADCNADGSITEEELRFVPSARAVRLSLGSAFAPPVASIRSLKEVVVGDLQECSQDQLSEYYRRHGAGCLQIGSGKLSNTGALTEALVKMLDEDQDGKVSQAELSKAEGSLRRLDTNDDQLIGVGELVPNGTYPGHAATTALEASTDLDISTAGDRRLMLKMLQSPAKSGHAASSPPEAEAPAAENTASEARMVPAVWKIAIADDVRDLPLTTVCSARCESWSVSGPLNELFGRLSETIAEADDKPLSEDRGGQSRNQRSSRAWLTPLVDRNRDGQASQEELDQWLALQRQLVHGQLLISVYYGGGLFELLDANHDAALSTRELRTSWSTLEAASCTADGYLEIPRIPNVLLFIASQGYVEGFAKPLPSDVEWFRQMDRNADGDVSRREFTGSPEAFDHLDQDHDGLISTGEAAANG